MGYKSLGDAMHRRHIVKKYVLLGLCSLALAGAGAAPESGASVANEAPSAATHSVTPIGTRPVAPTGPQVTVRQLQEKQVINFTAKQQDDSSLEKGVTKVTQEGQNGERTKTFSVTYTDGKETARQLVSDQVTKPAVEQITAVGTHVTPVQAPASNSGYVNVDGNYVPSPSNNPAGATARCRDGTYSYSQNHRGTCSHHGGVAEWF